MTKAERAVHEKAMDLISRQAAEIERLRGEVAHLEGLLTLSGKVSRKLAEAVFSEYSSRA